MPKPPKCGECKKPFIPIRPLQVVCTPTCAISKSRKDEQKKRDKVYREKKKVLRAKLKKIPELKREARAAFQAWIRKRDENLPCISCGKMTAIQWDGGHYLKAEIYSGMIFDERNCNRQDSYCNDYLAGNVIEYRKGLIARYGIEYVEQLESEADEKRVYKWTKEELIEIKKKYREKLRHENNNFA